MVLFELVELMRSISHVIKFMVFLMWEELKLPKSSEEVETILQEKTSCKLGQTRTLHFEIIDTMFSLTTREN